MIWLDSAYDCGWNESLFGKIGDRVLKIWPDTSFGSKSLSDSKFSTFLRFNNFIGFIL